MQLSISKLGLIELSFDKDVVFVEDVHVQVETHHDWAVYFGSQLDSKIRVLVSVLDRDWYEDFQQPKTLIKSSIEHCRLKQDWNVW